MGGRMDIYMIDGRMDPLTALRLGLVWSGLIRTLNDLHIRAVRPHQTASLSLPGRVRGRLQRMDADPG